MKSLFTGFASTGVPANISDHAQRIYSKVITEYTADGKVAVCVPLKEVEQVDQFILEVQEILARMEEENSVLAHRLARYYRIPIKHS